MTRSKIILGLLIAAFAASGAWSSITQITHLEISAHGDHSLSTLLAPQHALAALGPLLPTLLLVSAALRAHRCGMTLDRCIGARELVGSVVLLEVAEIASGSMAHSWLVTSALIFVAMTISWLLTAITVRVVQIVARRLTLHLAERHAGSSVPTMRCRFNVVHPSRAWLARRARRGPPVVLLAAI